MIPPGQTIYAGTGPKGRIYRLTPDGKGNIFYTTKQEHVLCLAVGPDDMLYAGTDKGGLVYRIDPKGKGFVLYQAPQTEVRTLIVTAEAVYAGTSAPTHRRGGPEAPRSRIQRRRRPSRQSTPGRGAETRIRIAPRQARLAWAQARLQKKYEKYMKSFRPCNMKSGNTQPRQYPPRPHRQAKNRPMRRLPQPPGAGDNSVYRIAHDGTVREIFREKALVLCLLRHNGRLLVGTGMDGQLFEIDEASRERSEIARLDHGQILCMCKRRDGSIVLGTGDPGKLYTLQDKYAARHRGLGSPRCQDHQQVGLSAGRLTHRREPVLPLPRGPATWPSRTKPGAPGRPSSPTPSRQRRSRYHRPVSSSTA